MVYTFGVAPEFAPLPGIKQFWGVAVRKTKSHASHFYLTVFPLSVTLSVDPTDEGKKLIIYFTRVLGEPEFVYRDKKPLITLMIIPLNGTQSTIAKQQRKGFNIF